MKNCNESNCTSEKDNIFVCQCSHQKSHKNGEICPICFPGVTISRPNESEQLISEDEREEIKEEEVGNDKKESDSEEDEDEHEEEEREELEIENEGLNENKRRNGEDTLEEKKKIVEALIEEEFNIPKEDNQIEEEKMKKISEVREESSGMEFGNTKVSLHRSIIFFFSSLLILIHF